MIDVLYIVFSLENLEQGITSYFHNSSTLQIENYRKQLSVAWGHIPLDCRI